MFTNSGSVLLPGKIHTIMTYAMNRRIGFLLNCSTCTSNKIHMIHMILLYHITRRKTMIGKERYSILPVLQDVINVCDSLKLFILRSTVCVWKKWNTTLGITAILSIFTLNFYIYQILKMRAVIFSSIRVYEYTSMPEVTSITILIKCCWTSLYINMALTGIHTS